MLLPSPVSKAHHPDDPFGKMAQATTQALQTNVLFNSFDFEIFVARPFVVLMTREKGKARDTTEERKRQLGALACGIWRNWLKVRADWHLQSTKNDTLEDPEPFVWLAFHNQAAYEQYSKESNPKDQTPGSRAFYSTATHFVRFYDDPQRDPSIIIIHETLHQLMDRFSKISSTKYQNYCFTEGAPEYFAGYQGSGESLVLGELTRPRRFKELQRIHTFFDDGKKICYPQKDRRLQITPDDWIFFDVPMLLCLRDKMWVRGISNALVEQFKRSEYMRRSSCKEFVEGGEVGFHSKFYAFSWAFTYWLNKNCPEEYRRYASMTLNTDRGGDAETFLEAFNIQPVQPLPDIKCLVGPDNRDVTTNQRAAVACLDERIAILRQTPAIQDMHRRWAEWMNTTFEKLPISPEEDFSWYVDPGSSLSFQLLVLNDMQSCAADRKL